MSGTEVVTVDEKYEEPVESVHRASKDRNDVVPDWYIDEESREGELTFTQVRDWYIDEESREGELTSTQVRFSRNRILNGRTNQKRRQAAAVAVSPTASDLVTPLLVTSKFGVFDTNKCKRWLDNLESYLEQEQIGHVLTEPCPDARDPEIARWKEDDFSCRNFILRTMFNPQLCVQLCKTAKELWDTIKTIYTEMADRESWRNLRMNFFMRQREVVYVLTEPCPDDEKIAKWKEDDYSCRNLILQEMVVPQYANYMTAKELWDTLQAQILGKLSRGRKKEAGEYQIPEQEERVENEERRAELKKMVTRKEEEIERLGKMVREMGEEIGSLKEEVEKKEEQIYEPYSSISSAWRHLDPVVKFSSALVLPTTPNGFHRMDTGASTYEPDDGYETSYHNDDEFSTELRNPINKLPGDNSLVRRNPTRADILKQKPTPFNSEADSLETRSDPGNLSLKW